MYIIHMTASGKEPAGHCRRQEFKVWVRKMPWRRAWHQRQYSCLENSMVGEDWCLQFTGVGGGQTVAHD